MKQSKIFWKSNFPWSGNTPRGWNPEKWRKISKQTNQQKYIKFYQAFNLTWFYTISNRWALSRNSKYKWGPSYIIKIQRSQKFIPSRIAGGRAQNQTYKGCRKFTHNKIITRSRRTKSKSSQATQLYWYLISSHAQVIQS